MVLSDHESSGKSSIQKVLCSVKTHLSGRAKLWLQNFDGGSKLGVNLAEVKKKTNVGCYFMKYFCLFVCIILAH